MLRSACGHFVRRGLIYCEECGAEVLPLLRPDAALQGAPLLSGLGQSASERALQRWSIGSDSSCDIYLPYPAVESQHAWLHFDGKTYSIQDCGSQTGVFHQTPDCRVQTAQIEPTDWVYLGSYPVRARRLLTQKSWRERRDLKAIPIVDEILIGSHERCDLCIDREGIKSRHARVTREGMTFTLESLGSAPLRLDNRPVQGKVVLNNGAKLNICGLILYYESGSLWPEEIWRRYQIELDEISLVIQQGTEEKTLLDRISFTVMPGEVCAVMGMSGAGKTTLLKNINGYLRPTSGEVLINGISLHDNYDHFKLVMGYVPQENIFHKDLTVYQALLYSARLRLGKEVSLEEIQARIQTILERLDLYGSNKQITTTRVANLSGGQKRLLSIGIELISDPGIFILDEPTSGLSSEDARKIMGVLERLAAEGRVILFTVHQPSQEIYENLDMVVYLHKGGRLAYAGPTSPDSLTFTQPLADVEKLRHKPENVLTALESKPPEFWQNRYLNSSYVQEYVTCRRGYLPSPDIPSPRKQTLAERFNQAVILLHRDLKIRLQDLINTGVLLAQAPVIGILIVMAFSRGDSEVDLQSSARILYLLSITAIWFGCSNSARDICGEWPVYQRERMFNLDLFAYLSAKILSGCLIGLTQCLLLLPLVMGPCNLESSFFSLFLICWLTTVAGTSLGLMISAFASPFKKSNEIAIGIIPLVLLPMVILGGLIKPHQEMNAGTRFLSDLTVTRWAFQTLVVSESHELDRLKGSNSTPLPQNAMISAFFSEPDSREESTGLKVIVFMSALFLFVTFLLLKFRDIL